VPDLKGDALGDDELFAGVTELVQATKDGDVDTAGTVANRLK
jgi:hypothetical protein